MSTLTYREAIRETLAAEMRADETVFVLGEIVASRGGSAFVTEGLVEEFGPERVLETPVSENAIVGSALGAALDGMRPVAELYQADFLFTTGNEVINDVPKWRYQHRYEGELPVVLRAQMGVPPGGGSGPEHSQCPEAFLHHAPGLTVVTPGTAADAAGLLRSAIRGGDPVVYLEHKRLYDRAEPVPDDPEHTVPLGEATVRRDGSDATVVAWAWMLDRAIEAADALESQGVDVEVIDPRTVKPFDYGTVVESVRRTGSLVVAEESPKTGSIGAEVVARVVEAGVDLAAPPARVALPDVPHPYHPGVEDALLPGADDVERAVLETVDE